MLRDRALAITILALLAVSLACNAFAGRLEPFPPPPAPLATEEANGVAGETPQPTVPQALAPLENARLTVLADLNVRSGPGLEYDRVGFLLKDETVPVLGVHEPSGWWKIDCPDIANGSECWVSGGEQYTRAEYVEAVAGVEAPSTPTPLPPRLEEGQGVLAFVDGGLPYAARLDLEGALPRLISEPLQLADGVLVETLSISPDGRRVAFLSSTADANALYAANIDGEDRRLLIDAADIPSAAGDAPGFRVLIDQIAWLPDGAGLAFNTVALSRTGPGVMSQEDLWQVDLDGEFSLLLPAGEGGGDFLITTNNQVLLSRAGAIARAEMDGSNRQLLVEFPPINTASEYIYYPVFQELDTADVHVFVPDAEPWEPEAWITLWQIPPSGPARQLGSIEGNALFDPLLWSPDGRRLAFVERSSGEDGAALSRLMISDGKGINANAYAGGDNLVVYDWSVQGESLLYAGEGFYAIGRINGPPAQFFLEAGQRLASAAWISDESFAGALGYPGTSAWELFTSNTSGEIEVLRTVSADQPLFDFWTP